jgi:hypothetical protein
MTRRKVSAAIVLLLMTLVFFTGAASGASILSSASQIAQVVSPADNSGNFPISSMLTVDASGALKPIPGPMPENQVFILTRIAWSFMATDPTLTEKVMLNVGDYYRSHVQLSNGFCTAVDGGDPGIPIINLTPSVFVQKEGDPDNQPIPGKLNLRLMGYAAKIN